VHPPAQHGEAGLRCWPASAGRAAANVHRRLPPLWVDVVAAELSKVGTTTDSCQSHGRSRSRSRSPRGDACGCLSRAAGRPCTRAVECWS